MFERLLILEYVQAYVCSPKWVKLLKVHNCQIAEPPALELRIHLRSCKLMFQSSKQQAKKSPLVAGLVGSIALLTAGLVGWIDNSRAAI